MHHKHLFTLSVCFFISQFSLDADPAQHPEWKGRIGLEGRVQVVANPKEPMFSDNVLSLDEELAIDTNETDKTEEMFQTIVSLAVDDDDHVFVLDKKAGNVKVFDQYGKFLKTIGRKGDGPGEFKAPDRCVLAPNNDLYIHDTENWKMHVFDANGTFRRQIPVRMPFFEGPKFTSKGEMVASHGVLGEELFFILKKFDTDMDPIVSFATIPIQKPPRVHVFVYYTASDLKWDVSSRDEVIWGVMTSPKYELFVHDAEGEYIRKITKEYNPVRLSKKEYEKLMTKWFGKVPTSAQWDLVIPPNYPPFQGFLCDDDGHIFVKRFVEVDRSEKHYFDVFDEEGRYIANITLDINFQFGIFKNKKFFAIAEDEEGFQTVRRYKVTWHYKN
jgi:hypothetical protein